MNIAKVMNGIRMTKNSVHILMMFIKNEQIDKVNNRHCISVVLSCVSEGLVSIFFYKMAA